MTVFQRKANAPGTEYDPTDIYTLYAEDVNKITDALGTSETNITDINDSIKDIKKDIADLEAEIGSGTSGCPFPINSIYLSVSSSDPSLIWPGTAWTPYAQGRTLLGVGYNGTSTYSVAEQLGGRERVTLTINEMPSHEHDVNGYGFKLAEGTVGWRLGGMGTETGYGIVKPTGGGASHENRMPFITTYMWKRTA